jgi:hypothetical protein
VSRPSGNAWLVLAKRFNVSTLMNPVSTFILESRLLHERLDEERLDELPGPTAMCWSTGQPPLRLWWLSSPDKRRRPWCRHEDTHSSRFFTDEVNRKKEEKERWQT